MYQNRVEKDWVFSDSAHISALNLIYQKFYNIKEVRKASIIEDLEKGIDYWVDVQNGAEKFSFSIQERFRTLGKFTQDSQEFTLKYERKNSESTNQKNQNSSK